MLARPPMDVRTAATRSVAVTDGGRNQLERRRIASHPAADSKRASATRPNSDTVGTFEGPMAPVTTTARQWVVAEHEGATDIGADCCRVATTPRNALTARGRLSGYPSLPRGRSVGVAIECGSLVG